MTCILNMLVFPDWLDLDLVWILLFLERILFSTSFKVYRITVFNSPWQFFVTRAQSLLECMQNCNERLFVLRHFMASLNSFLLVIMYDFIK